MKDVRWMTELDWDQYTEPELTAIVRRIKRVIAAKTSDWRIGAKVIFNQRGCVHKGKILKVNKRSVVVECTDSEYWISGKQLKEMIYAD